MDDQHVEGGGRCVRYGVVGCGMMGEEHIRNLAAMAGRTPLTGGVHVELVALADPHPPSLAKGLAAAATAGWSNVQVFPDVNSLLASSTCECDVLVVAAPNMTHAALLAAILRHPRRHHVLVEKPLATTVRGCDMVIALAAAREPPSAGVVQVGLEYRFMPPVAALLHEVRGGAVGRVHMVAIREHRFPFLVKVGDWNRFSANSGGTLVEKCCHFFDLMNLILHDTPTRVMASGAQSVNHLDEEYGGKASDILDNAYVIVEYSGGGRACLDLCMFAEGSRNEQEICVVGDKGKVEALVPEGIVRVGSREGGRVGVVTRTCTDDRIQYEGLHHGASFIEHLQFLRAIAGPAAAAHHLAGLEAGRVAVAMGIAAHVSIDTGRPVVLADVLSQAAVWLPGEAGEEEALAKGALG
ncbi:hypothetical protein CLOM_g19482 [Closterium sp. NIES-68]|nr:hypothetical protein CLOM_g19482 [Closterium sp. NIES-68]GJP81976.1 hypothetical protein CLOP_g12101 [Closterium sp. NIES-67]